MRPTPALLVLAGAGVLMLVFAIITPADVDLWLSGTLEEVLEQQKPADDKAIVLMPKTKDAA